MSGTVVSCRGQSIFTPAPASLIFQLTFPQSPLTSILYLLSPLRFNHQEILLVLSSKDRESDCFSSLPSYTLVQDTTNFFMRLLMLNSSACLLSPAPPTNLLLMQQLSVILQLYSKYLVPLLRASNIICLRVNSSLAKPTPQDSGEKICHNMDPNLNPWVGREDERVREWKVVLG